ncbi:hypothetical protein CONPUDRAFT_162038 [Coniophora puteana RWD-64-598 SS2]|uniref:Uncharacterized protein n=1 Tax=Coniophora puteana (strain RWD-64-598) TaxID=741705 RepID=A0A5M3N086_CONPW|nr:uncharacterized protein CONPUDRAFT_162038 [Coniophora puteana RWD-64-598 SS2]EIW84667.1 hypothetical protein CONPUDRAFT_162038 [Coniophora puteana RWD-64-598 SS2]
MSVQLADDHPLALELTSLRQTAARFEHEAHTAAVRLQRHSLETSYSTDRVHILERENARLTEELALMRAHPDTTPHPATIQVQELTLALRRASEKLDAIEHTLSERTAQFTAARNDLAKAKHETEGAHELAAQAQAREEESRARERAMEGRIRAAQKERDMSDLVVQEYADLVRSLEGRPHAHVHGNGHAKVPSAGSGTESASGSTSTVTLVDGLQEGKHGLHKLLGEFGGETERLEGVIAGLSRDIANLQVELQAERKAGAYTQSQLSEARVELDKLRADDNTAAKMVSRYMKFSQSTTNSLQTAMATQRTRYTATADTLTLKLSETEQTLEHERRQASRLRDVMDELCYDVARETFGRRREVALRLALLAREEGLAEGTRRWVRRAREVLERARPGGGDGAEGDEEKVHDGDEDASRVFDAFMGVILEAEEFVFRLDGDLGREGGSIADTAEDEDDQPIGVQARMISAKDAVAELSEELYVETQKRLELTQEVAELLTVLPDRVPNLKAAKRMVDKSTNVVSVVRVAKMANPPSLGGEEPVVIPKESAPSMPTDDAKDHALSSVSADIPNQQSAGDPHTIPLVTELVGSSGPTTPGLLSRDASENTLSTLLSADDFPYKDDTLISVVAEDVTLQPEVIDLTSRPPSPSSSPLPDNIVTSGTPAPVVGTSQTSPLGSLAELKSEPEPLQPSTQTTNPLLASLAQTKTRYDALQRAFRDCHLALQDLKATLASNSSPSLSPSHSPSSSPPSFISTALERLDDFSEDARVELEIRISDELLVARGLETLLSVPGALPTHQEREETETKAHAFVDGSDESVRGAMRKFAGKLEDLQHDIACLKRAVHELPPPPSPSTAEKQGGGWATWTAGLLGAAAHATPPRPHSPTFGSVMTSPRLRHVSSVGQLHSSSAASHGASPAPGGASADPFAALGLRIPMPVRAAPPSSSSSHMHGPGGFGLGLNLGAGSPGQRQRTTSTIYGLGLGARSSPFVLGHSSSPARGSPKSVPSPGAGTGLGQRAVGGGPLGGGTMARRVSSASVLPTVRSANVGRKGGGVEETSDVE